MQDHNADVIHRSWATESLYSITQSHMNKPQLSYTIPEDKLLPHTRRVLNWQLKARLMDFT